MPPKSQRRRRNKGKGPQKPKPADQITPGTQATQATQATPETSTVPETPQRAQATFEPGKPRDKTYRGLHSRDDYATFEAQVMMAAGAHWPYWDPTNTDRPPMPTDPGTYSIREAERLASERFPLPTTPAGDLTADELRLHTQWSVARQAFLLRHRCDYAQRRTEWRAYAAAERLVMLYIWRHVDDLASLELMEREHVHEWMQYLHNAYGRKVGDPPYRYLAYAPSYEDSYWTGGGGGGGAYDDYDDDDGDYSDSEESDDFVAPRGYINIADVMCPKPFLRV